MWVLGLQAWHPESMSNDGLLVSIARYWAGVLCTVLLQSRTRKTRPGSFWRSPKEGQKGLVLFGFLNAQESQGL